MRVIPLTCIDILDSSIPGGGGHKLRPYPPAFSAAGSRGPGTAAHVLGSAVRSEIVHVVFGIEFHLGLVVLLHTYTKVLNSGLDHLEASR